MTHQNHHGTQAPLTVFQHPKTPRYRRYTMNLIKRLYTSFNRASSLNQFNDQGQKHGMWSSRYSNGQYKLIERYKDGQKHGVCTSYYPNGQTKLAEEYKHGIKDGIWASYYYNGNEKISGHYKNGKKDFAWYHYNIDGKKISRGYYTDGKRDYKYVEYNAQGQKTVLGHYKNGEKHGMWTTYEHGKKQKISYYENDNEVPNSEIPHTQSANTFKGFLGLQ